MLAIKKVGTESIPAIQELAEKTWAIAYASILPQEQLRYMLELFYSNNALEEQIAKGHQFILITDNEEPLGFAAYSLKSEDDLTLYRLHKLYVDPASQGSGAGKRLVDFIVADIKPKGAKILQLNVNRSNKAIGFYQKLGFIIRYEEDIDIGNGYFMNDYVMELPL